MLWHPYWQFTSGGSAPPVVVGQTPAGRSKGRRKRILVEVEGKDYYFADTDAAIDFMLARAEKVEKEIAEIPVRKAVVIADGVPVAKADAPQIEAKGSADAEEVARVLNERIEQIWAARVADLIALKLQELDDDDDEIMLLLG